MRRKADILAILLVILFALSLGMAGVSVYFDHAFRETLSSDYVLGELLDDLEAEANLGGAPAVESFHCDDYGLWDGKAAENFNAVLVGEDGAILARTGTLACGDMATLDMMLARYDRPIELSAEAAADGSTARHTTWARLGLLLGEEGQTRFIAYRIGDAPLKTGSVPTSTYVNSFPSLDAQLYARMTNDGYGEEQTFPATGEELAETEAYVRWENEQLAQAGPLRADVRALTGAFAGRTLVCFYLDNDALRATDVEKAQMYAHALEAVAAALVLYAAFSLLLAVWVFRDARRRDFLPAMWGLLTLIGNVVAWLVYMLVRSRGVGSRCPRCGTALRMGFAYCPACGAQVRRSCPACGHAAEDAWKVCPYCGGELPESPGPAQDAGGRGVEWAPPAK